ncbi:carboxymuconolactone decarboxylase family protein [Micromonospora phytophila]|uniref:carboxymuconolactone decarboxylase family protein n=1 Tax=Micromonospora phytophila TaxID=709888 RepID=UPI00202DFA4C|nr:carboxymuconolactone decarboxylase family protein [Micromonospora phytophila]MCM0674513.1 carboxymuconolactone decarboxylase family protein [Micromonospora phytophila]
MSRITPLTTPYSPETAAALHKWMPPDVDHDPLVLFRVLHRNPDLASRMRVLGGGLLAHGALSALDREIVIARVCALCHCEYEWGVHATVFANAVGLTADQLHATVRGTADDPVWPPRHRALVRAVDELHDTAHLSQPTWDALQRQYDASQLLEFLVLAGWYRTISYLANGLRLDNEPWAAPFPGHSA